jgi:lambda family phage portal protein
MSLWSRIRGRFSRGAAKAATTAKRWVYAAAQQNRLFEDWVASWMAPNEEHRYELRLIRNRSREQCRNNPIARRYLGLLDENVCGAEGITPRPLVYSPGGGLDEETGQQILNAWYDWGRAETCTADGALCWRDVERAVLEACARDGEALIELLPAFGNKYGFTVRVLDIDLLDEGFSRRAGTEGAEVIMSVEVDKWQRAVAYHLWSQLPGDSTMNRKQVRVPASRILHIKRMQGRAGQVRAEPWLTPVLVPLRVLDEYRMAELHAARASAENLGFIQPGVDAPAPDPNDPNAANAVLASEKVSITRLAPGETFAGFSPEHPTSAFGPFVKSVLRDIAAGLHVSYASLTGDLEGANYSSMRVGSLAERDRWRVLQNWLVAQLHEPIFAAWLRQAVVWQRVRLPGRLADVSVTWETRGWPWVDPQSDITAAAQEVSMGLMSLTRLAAERGRDFVEIMRERAREQEIADELGVPISLSLGGAPAAPASETPEPEPAPAEPEVVS